MGAQPNNQFWKLRLRHGRHHAIETPDELWENFCEYADWLEANPLIETDFRGKDSARVSIPKMRPFTKVGFALACGLSGWEVINDWKARNGFFEIVTRIENQIYNQKYEGAAAGFFKENLIVRDLQLKEQSDVDVSKPFIILRDASVDKKAD